MRSAAQPGNATSSRQPVVSAAIEVYEQRTNHPLQVRVREALAASGERLARFSPDREPEASELELFFQLSDHFNDDELVNWPHFTLRLLRARAIGPVLEVWRVPTGK